MKEHILKTRKVKEPAFSAIYVWLDPYNEGFECCMKKHMLSTLAWACDNEELKTQLQLNHGAVQKVAGQLCAAFKEEFQGNIRYSEEVLGAAPVQVMLDLIIHFIEDTVEASAEVN